MANKLPDSIAKNPRYSALEELRAVAGKEARAAQSSYRRLTGLFVLSTAIAGICSALILYGIEAKPDQSSNVILQWVHAPLIRTCLFLFQGGCLAAAAFSAHQLSGQNYSSIWTSRRLEAEEGRLLLQQMALEIGHENGPGDFQSAGRSFNDFTLGQINYLKNRMTRHARSASRLSVAGGGLAGLAALAAAISSLEQRTVLILLAFIGVCTPALTVALKSWSEATFDGDRAELHRRNWASLTEVFGERAQLEQAIANDDLDGALAYTKGVFDVLRADHAGFRKIRSQSNSVSPAKPIPVDTGTD